MNSAHYATRGVRGWLRYFFTPPMEQGWRYWNAPLFSRYGWRESWRFWTGYYRERAITK